MLDGRRRRPLTVTVAALLFILSRSAGVAAAGTSVDPALDSRLLGEYVSDHLKRTGIAGVSVAIVHGASVEWVAGYGHDSSGKPMTADTPMYAGSVSKSFNALAVMQLVEAGRVDLDKPVHEYLREFVLTDVRRLVATCRVGGALNPKLPFVAPP